MLSIAINSNSIENVGNDGGACEINIKLGNDEFNVYLSEEEVEVEFRKHNHIAENQYDTIIMIAALEKITTFLKLSTTIMVSKDVVREN